ncbi:MAG: hypothetical protein IPN84_04965 [Sphingomonadales bacterium]|jgi:hypothetical protein|nr:hypothetical protein [Sphingomonadales bacterium]
MKHFSALDDPEYAAFAWARYRRLMFGMVGFSTIAVLLIITYLYLTVPYIPKLILVMIFIGLMFTLLLMAALMGLVFLSSGSGHDEAVIDFDKDEA